MRIAAFVLAAGLMAVTACSGPESVKEARGRVDEFHRQLDREAYEAIWTTGAPDLQSALPKEDFIRLLTAIHTKLGKVKETKQTGWQANVNTGGSFASITMKTTFEKGAGEENFVFRNSDGGQKLAGYSIQSQDMMLR